VPSDLKIELGEEAGIDYSEKVGFARLNVQNVAFFRDT
jgi:hypothetical protein